MDETPIIFDCAGASLLGVLHRPPRASAAVGVVLVVGGPQYRVGSHRQFVLLARELAAAGIPVLRFDYRGMGDSGGAVRDFEDVDADIGVAVDTLLSEVDAVRHVVLWGLCDAATANAFYAPGDPRIVGQVAANPWVRTVEGAAQAYIKHYYLRRLLSAELWRKVFNREFDARSAIADFVAKLRQSRAAGTDAARTDARPLPERLRDAQLRFAGATLLIISGQDLTAKEYLDRVAESPPWQDWLAAPATDVQRLEAADHTFSRAAWRAQVATITRDWILALSV